MLKKNATWRRSALLSLLVLAGCASNSPPPPPVVVAPVVLTPLPASVTNPGLQPSANWQERASSYLQRVKAWSESETSK